MDKRFRLRASSLNSVQRCPGYAALANSQAYQRETVYTSRGTRIHALIAAHYGATEELDKLPMHNLPTDEDHEVVRRFLAWWGPLGRVPEENEGQLIEHSMQLDVDDTCYVSGTSDMVVIREGGLYVYDWKTGGGYHLPPMQSDLQMAAYALMAARQHKRDAVQVYRVLVEKHRFESRILLADELDLTEQKLVQLARQCAIDGRRITGSWCHKCLYRSSCLDFISQAEAWAQRAVSHEPEPLALEQAQRLVHALGALRALEAQAKDELRQFADANGGSFSLGDGSRYGARTDSRGRTSYRIYRG